MVVLTLMHDTVENHHDLILMMLIMHDDSPQYRARYCGESL